MNAGDMWAGRDAGPVSVEQVDQGAHVGVVQAVGPRERGPGQVKLH